MDNMYEKLEYFPKKDTKKENEKTTISSSIILKIWDIWTIPIENLNEFYKYVRRSRL